MDLNDCPSSKRRNRNMTRYAASSLSRRRFLQAASISRGSTTEQSCLG